MSLSLVEDIRTMADFENSPRKIVEQIHQTGRPVIVTKKGVADVVIMDAAMFERQLKVVNLARLLAAGEADIQAGRVRPIEHFSKDLAGGKKVSS